MKRTLLLFIAFIALFFHKEIFNNHVFYCCDNLTIIIPSRKFLTDSLLHGIFPLWNPYIFSGGPFLADINLGLLSPLNILYFVLPLFTALTATVIFSFFIAITGMYVLARRMGISSMGSMVTAIVFGFSGAMITYTNNISILQVAALAPWIVWAADVYMMKPSRNTLGIASVTLAFQIFSGHPQLTFYTLLFLIVWSLFRVRVFRKAILLWVQLALIVFLLTAVQIIPFISFTEHSTRIGRDYAYATFGSLNPIDLVRFGLPSVVGNLSANFVLARNGSIYGFVGVLPLVLSVFAKRSERTVRFFWILAGVSLLLAFGKYTPVFYLAYRFIPGIASFREPEHFLFIYTFCIALLSGFGLDVVVKNKKVVPIFLMASLVYGIVGMSLFLFGIQLFTTVLSHMPQPLYLKLSHIPMDIWRQWFLLNVQYALVVGALILCAMVTLKKLPKIAGFIICFLVFLELFLYSSHGLITVSEKTVEKWIAMGRKTADAVGAIDTNKEKIFTDHQSYFYPHARGKPYADMPEEMAWQFKILRPNLNILYGLPSIDGYASVVGSTYAQEFEKRSADPTGINIPTNNLILRSHGVSRVIQVAGDAIAIQKITPNFHPSSLRYDTRPVTIGGILTLVGIGICFLLLMSG